MYTKIPLAVVLAVTLASCASGMERMRGEESSSKYIDYAGAPVEQFASFRIDGWTPVSRNQLVLWTGINEAYLLKVWDSCQDLQFANRIAVTSTADTISRFDKVRVGRDQCPISEIRPIDVKQMKADRALARKKDGAKTAM
jgi:hypothetical protein